MCSSISKRDDKFITTDYLQQCPTTPSGEFLFQVFGALAQYERALIQERVVAGLAAARKRGRIGGRPQAITGEKLDAIVAALDGGMSKAAVCRNFMSSALR
jgi:DNA invertase Pin-like site-specific DNA recombinase